MQMTDTRRHAYHLDKALMIEKIFLYATGKRDREGRQVYSLTMNSPADVAKKCVIEELSEFDCRVVSLHPYQIGDLVTLYGKAFAEDFGANGEIASVMGRCYHCGPNGKEKNLYDAYFTFVGINPTSLKNIRTSLRKEYVNKKG
mgnify:CR=1 FL=1